MEFWKKDENYRLVGVRESPDYPLERASAVIKGSVEVNPVENVLGGIAIDDSLDLPDTQEE